VRSGGERRGGWEMRGGIAYGRWVYFMNFSDKVTGNTQVTRDGILAPEKMGALNCL
jgi:hypothetical protein